jgi:hypothetical protein
MRYGYEGSAEQSMKIMGRRLIHQVSTATHALPNCNMEDQEQCSIPCIVVVDNLFVEL